MRNLVPASVLALASVPAWALDGPAEAPIEASPVITVLFLLVFAGCIGVYLWMTLRNEKARKEGKDEAGPAS